MAWASLALDWHRGLAELFVHTAAVHTFHDRLHLPSVAWRDAFLSVSAQEVGIQDDGGGEHQGEEVDVHEDAAVEGSVLAGL